MKHHPTIGHYYANLLEKHLDSAIQRKLDTTANFKKKLAGIETIDNAKRKGYAPSMAQVEALKNCIMKEANQLYAQERFRALEANKAIQELVGELLRHIAVLNEGWKQKKQFTFDDEALNDLAGEAAALIQSEHEMAKQHFN